MQLLDELRQKKNVNKHSIHVKKSVFCSLLDLMVLNLYRLGQYIFFFASLIFYIILKE